MNRLDGCRGKGGGASDGALDRREFCTEALKLGGAAALLALGVGAAGPRPARAAAPADIAAVKGPGAAATRRAVELIGGMRRFVRPGQRVVVKPNIGWDRAPEQA